MGTAEIDTTPLADVAFQLVIFFLVAATFSTTLGLDFQLPAPIDREELHEPEEAVLVEVLRHGGLRVDGRSLALDQLLTYLEPKLRANPGKPVLVRPELEAAYGRAVDVLDELRQGRTRLRLEQDITIALPTARELQLLGR